MSSEPRNEIDELQSQETRDSDTAEDRVDIHDVIEVCLEALVAVGPVEDLARLRNLLPSADDSTRKFVLIELIKLDMAMAAENGELRQIEGYLAALDGLLSSDSIPIDLIMEEIQLRKQLGQEPKMSEVADRFPNFDSTLNQLVVECEATATAAKPEAIPEQPVGSEIDDFLVVQELGRGAFAHVYLARQVSMQRLVALKVSRGKGDEPRALAQFDHPNIVRVFDQRPLPQQDLHLLYMEFVPGGTLSDVVKLVRFNMERRKGSLLLDAVDQNLLRVAQVVPEYSQTRTWVGEAEWPTVVAWIGVCVARALGVSHARGVLHRDVKPANVLLSNEGVPKLADFNVSHAGAAGRAGAAASFGGSIGYMSPEHLIAIQPSAREEEHEVRETADIYALGILLWELWQGRRPFEVVGHAFSWTASVQQQLDARERELVTPQYVGDEFSGSASERVLEKTLRKSLAYDPDERFASGAELAGRLRLALHPDAASLFDPSPRSISSRLAGLSPWFVAGVAILVPHIAAGFFNYEYNVHETMPSKKEQLALMKVALWVNPVFYTVGAALTVWFTRYMARGVKAAREGDTASDHDIDETLALGQRAAVIGGSLWAVSSLMFPLFLPFMVDHFAPMQAAQFIVSFLICGGVAMIYPFFGLALVATLSYYPMMVRGSMQDELFEVRMHRMLRRSDFYLLVSAIIPLMAAGLLVFSESQHPRFMLIAIGAGIMGLLASYIANRTISRTWARMNEVLANRSSAVPSSAPV